MSNTLLTIDMITREMLRVFHQKANLITNLNRQYDDQYAREGAKIGTTLRVRKPAQYAARTSATLSANDHTETKVDLTLGSQYGVDVNFSSLELTLSLDDFSQRVIDPAMSVLVAKVESVVADALLDAAENNVLGTTSVDLADLSAAREKLTWNLAPQDNNRFVWLNPTHTSGVLNDTKGLFQDAGAISSQYKEGILGRIQGFDTFENTNLTGHVTGAGIAGSPLTNGSVQDGATIAIDGLTNGTTSGVKKGDYVTFATVDACHFETKADLGYLKQFPVTADTAGTSAEAMSIPISPSIVTSGAFQNCVIVGSTTGGVPDGQVVTQVGTPATSYTRSLAAHRDYAAFVTGDLVVPNGVDFARRDVLDGVSMRIVRAYDVNNDAFPCRIDILWGYAVLNAHQGCSIWLEA